MDANQLFGKLLKKWQNVVFSQKKKKWKKKKTFWEVFVTTGLLIFRLKCKGV